MSVTRRLASVSALLCLGLGALGLAGETPRQPQPSLAIASTSGRDLFAFYCSSCHGRDGRGDGRSRGRSRWPPDLTAIALRHGGTFPAREVESSISGEGGSMMRSHGTRDMPVWGPIFRALDPGSEKRTQIRIANLVRFIESIQGTQAASNPSRESPPSHNASTTRVSQ